MSNRRLAALWAAVLTIGAVAGALWGLLTLADLADRAEQERGEYT